MESNKSTHIRADEFYKQAPSKEEKKPNSYHPGTPVLLKLTGEKLLVLAELPLEPDEYTLGVKYLTRTVDHKKKVVFGCEIKTASESPQAVQATK